MIESEPRPRKRLKVVRPLVVSLVIYGITKCFTLPALSGGYPAALEGTAAHLIRQLDQAA